MSPNKQIGGKLKEKTVALLFGAFCWHGLGSLVPFYEEPFWYLWVFFFLAGPTPSHRTQRLTEWFDDYVNDVNEMLWPSQLTDLNPNEHCWENLDWCVWQHSPTQSSRLQEREYNLDQFSSVNNSSRVLQRCTEVWVGIWP